MKTGTRSLITLLAAAFAAQTCSSGRVPSDLVLSVNPPTVSFGTVNKGHTVHRPVTLKHAGTGGTIRIERLEFETGTSPEFTFDPLAAQELNPGESVTLQVHYSPQDSDADQGAILIRHNIASQGYETRIPLLALAQVASLTCDPNPLDFGQVRSGDASPPRDLVLRNDGSDDMLIERLPYLRVDSSQDFHQVGDPVLQGGGTFPVTLKPGEFVGLVYEYRPTGGGADDGYLVVDTETKGVKNIVTCTLHGQEVGPKIVVFPGEIHFGDVPLNEKRTETVTVENQGFSTDPEDSMLVIPAGGITFSPGSNEDLGLADTQGSAAATLPPEDWYLKADDYPNHAQVADIPTSRTFQVTWTPSKAVADTGAPIGWLVIPSNDPLNNPVQIAIRGRVAAPLINVFPNPVDFYTIGQMITGEQTLTVQNLGNGDLEFPAAFAIENDSLGEFAIVADPTFKPTLPTFDPATDCATQPEDCVIRGNASRGVVLQFTNKGPATGTATARLVIRSNDPTSPTVYVDLKATRGGTPTCEPVLAPGKLDYGVVPKGYYKEMTMKLVNNGTGYCSFQSARVEDCTGFMGMTTSCAEPGKGTLSKVFTIMGLPPAVQNGLKPKSSLDFKIRFTPPQQESIFAQLMSYVALFSVQVHDSQLKQVKTVPACSGGGLPGLPGCQPNLQAQSGVAKISVLPGEVDFGVVTIGCYSKTYKICIYNTGSAPLTISNISTAGCSPEFKKKNVPPLPKTLSAGVPVCFEMVYVPQDAGPDNCTARIESTDSSSPLVSIFLKGEGTFETEHTDLFTQVSGQEVDVLFVIDDSGSMCGEQDQLAAAFDYFIQNAKVWNNDYHLGIVGINVVDETVRGMLNYGDPKKMPRFLTPTTGTKEKFVEFAKLGCGGGPNCGGFGGPCSDEQEAGLLAAQIALSAPLTTDTGVACNSDADCKNNPNVCPDAASCPYRCVDKTCGGWNKGFLRDDAQLEIIVLADEEDQSPGAVATYIDFLKSIKGFYNINMMHFHSIVGANPPTCEESDAGKRYIQTSQETNGIIGDICDTNYYQTMSDIGEITFGLKVQFFLTRLADPGTVKVWVNNQSCTTGWTYDGLSNSVVFDDKGPCMPQPGDKIKVYYKTLCLKE